VKNESEILVEIDKVIGSKLHRDDNIPLWQFVRIVNSNEAGLSALIIRIHHVIGDGVGLVATMSKMFIDEVTGETLALEIAENMRSSSSKSIKKQVSIFSVIVDFISSTFAVFALGLSRFDTILKFGAQNRVNVTMANTTRKSVILPTINLEFIKAIKNAANVTINDVLLTVTGGVIEKYCKIKGDPSFNKRSSVFNRVLMPIAFPRPKSELENPMTALSNKWVFISASMHLNLASVFDRLKACHETTNQLKSSLKPVITLWVQQNLMKLAPLFVQRKMAFDVCSRHTVVFSNVPGFQSPVSLCGQRLLGRE